MSTPFFDFFFQRRKNHWPSFKFQKQQPGYTEVEGGEREKDSIVEAGPYWKHEPWTGFYKHWIAYICPNIYISKLVQLLHSVHDSFLSYLCLVCDVDYS